MPITAGTKIADIRSASRCARPLPVRAAETRATIWASAVCAPTAVARTVSTPLVFTVAPHPGLPGAQFEQGADRVAGPQLRPCLEVAAQADEGDDQRGALEVRLA